MFDKILIANRGEIACRVAATARRLGIRTVAVYSDADARAKHVAACDEAYRLGPAPANESYLRGDRILEIARATGAQAIHPGYGFLSENAGFAHAVEDAGLAFIGPPASAIAAMGSKSAAKTLMQRAEVPLVPGYHGNDQDPAHLAREAERIGWPVLIKASAGGGGKGMRIVEEAGQFDALLASCQREAKNAFGNDRVLIERYVVRPRHIEIQIFADKHENCVYLFERDCSVQRRFQKVIEEAPAPAMTEERREAMGRAAVAAAKAVGYVGAGTVEFIADQSGAFWFMEMNTRLQVEHPITEMITGQDLVEWQLRVAAGEPLPLAQSALRIDGHAIEVRLYAENPAKGFLPSSGTLRRLRMPEGAAFCNNAPVRVDSGVREGDTITPFYDPMIAKLICHGRDRNEARQRMERALSEVQVVGVATNAAFLGRLMRDAAFSAADLDTGLIERQKESLFAPPAPPDLRTLAIAAGAILALEGDDEAPANGSRSGPTLAAGSTGARNVAASAGARHAGASPGAGGRGAFADGAPNSLATWRDPWSAADGWRAGPPLLRPMRFGSPEEPHEVGLEYTAAGWTVHAGKDRINLARLSHDSITGVLSGLVGDGAFQVPVALDGETLYLFGPQGVLALRWATPLTHAGDHVIDTGGLTAPMPGKVVAVLVASGQEVERGQPLVVIEAMKMEHTISAPADGKVTELPYQVGDQVDEGAALIGFDATQSK